MIMKSELRECLALKIQVQRLLDENASLKKSLSEATDTINKLRNSTTTVSALGSSASRYASQPPLSSTVAMNNTTTDITITTTDDNSYSSRAKRNLPPRKPNARKVRAAVRLFEASAYALRNDNDMSDSDNASGPLYQYVYLNLKYRDKASAVRTKLRALGIDNGRILDLHYPTRGVVSILIHTDYFPTLTSILEEHELNPLSDFNPLDTSTLKDPALASLSEEEKQAKLLELHQSRLCRALNFVRPYLKGLISRDFIQQGWLTPAQVKTALTPTTSVTSNNSITATNPSHSKLINDPPK